jgi:hypothetical protein
VISPEDSAWQRLLTLSGVAQAADAARVAVDRLLGDRSAAALADRLAVDSAVRGAWASACLDGDEVTLADARGGRVDGHPVLAGALRAYTELASLRSIWRTAPLQALARLHLLAAADLVPPERLGRPRDAAAGEPVRAAVLLARAPAQVPAAIVAAAVEAELLCGDAFEGGNGTVARAAARLVLATRGLDPALLCVPEQGQWEAAGGTDAIRGWGGGTEDGQAAWLLHWCGGLATGAAQALATAQSLTRR